MTFHIETERLILRDLRLTDVASMFELDSNPLVHEHLPGKPFTDVKQSVEYVESVLIQYRENGIGRWATIEKASGNFIGWSGLRLNTEYAMNGHSNYLDIGFRLMPKYWGKGYATEASFAALDYAFNTMQLDLVNGITEIDNIGSHVVLLKIGLKYTEDFFFKKEQMKLRWYELKKENYE